MAAVKLEGFQNVKVKHVSWKKKSTPVRTNTHTHARTHAGPCPRVMLSLSLRDNIIDCQSLGEMNSDGSIQQSSEVRPRRHRN